jgi:predicted Zn-dependent protease with MMP-like domain
MDQRQFEALVEEALDGIPEPFRARLENVDVVIEDQPAPSLLRSMGMDPKRDTLFGLYDGVPLTEREATYGMALPDRITIFYRPLVRTFRTPAAIRREIQKTVIHEIGHFLGLDEEEIEGEGY